ncbi:MAG: efflux RND transporter permease subunit [Desulfuromonadales bacterium]|nr:efflux RND transporter permease subunit [Desulfuromonadales bacterium]
MLIANVAIQRRSSVFALMLIIVVVGIHSYLTLPRESTPDITIPYVLVVTPYEGVASADIESLITNPIERKLRGLKNVEEIRSVSAEDSSMITIEFIPDVNIDDAIQWVRDKVDQAKRDLPDDLENDPQILEVNLAEFPVMMVAISGDLPETVLKGVAEELEEHIEELPGVLDVVLTGGREREVRVEIDPDRMAALQLSFSEIVTAVARENVNIPGGSIDIGKGKYLLRIPGEFTDPAEIDDLIMVVRDGRPIYYKDLATVHFTFEDAKNYARLNGKPSISLAVKKRTGENIIAVTDRVFALLDAARPLLPAGVELSVTLNQSKDIRHMVAELENNILTGLILVIAVLFMFLGMRNAFFVALAIPFSMLMSFTIIQILGLTLNMVVLFSLILALGMLVDNAIVIVENIYRHRQEGRERVEAARIAASEVGWPIITSTITTLCAFFPMLFWPGIMGEFMQFLPLTLIITLASSLFVALVISPTVCANFMRIKSGEVAIDIERTLVVRAYRRTLQWALGRPLTTLGLALGLLVAITSLFGVLVAKQVLGVELFPDVEPNRAFVEIKAPEGTSLDTSDSYARIVEAAALHETELKHVTAEIGVAPSGEAGAESGSQSHMGRVSLEFLDSEDRQEPSSALLDRLRQTLVGFTGAEIKVEKEKPGPPTGPPVSIEVSGERVVVLEQLVAGIRERIKGVPGLVDLKDDLSRAKPEIRVLVDRQKATLLGLSTADISTMVKAAINGSKMGVYRHGKDEYDIIVRLPEARRQSLADIESLLIPTVSGQQVPLTTVARLELGTGFGSIRHINQNRVVTISGNTSGRNSNDVLLDIQALLADYDLPAGYRVVYSGEQKEQQKAIDFLGKAFLVALFLIVLVLITQFNSVSQTFIVMTSVVLSLSGVFAGLIVTMTNFGIIMTGIGVISLAGVVVNNAIVLIDYINQLRRGGLELEDALLRGGLIRFRPVMLTAITTILGLLPMAVGVSFNFRDLSWVIGGESAQWWGPMAVAVIFGLAVATLLTLVVVPVLYALFARIKENMAQRFGVQTKV